MEAGSHSPRYIRSRIANACDGCKARKVKCDGNLPCSYCARRQRSHDCHYSAQRRRRTTQNNHALPHSPSPSERESRTRSTREGSPNAAERVTAPPSPGTPRYPARSRLRQSLDASASAAEDETDVPREARLLCDAQGKLVFIGDCAPLSLFQSVRQLVTSKVAHNAFAPQTSRYSALENAPARHRSRAPSFGVVPDVNSADVAPAVAAYLATTAGLADLFDDARLLDELLLWANLDQKPINVTSIVNFLVLAIGRQMDNEELAQDYFEYARDQAYSSLIDNLSIGTVQAFTLITVYMLCSCQINGAFLFFGIAVRAAYSIGIHRTEVNARFGIEGHRQRDRLWKSLRIVDLCLSTSMGRPPAMSDVDCTVAYRDVDGDGNDVFDLLNASVQILLIVEAIVDEIYSRKKISLQLTEGISVRLREWSIRWLQQLKDAIAQSPAQDTAQITGACQVLSTYYYAVMLVSRPFLMYELCRRLSDGPSSPSYSTHTSGKSKLADACIDAASLMVDPVLDLIERGVLNSRVPILVSWLFASSLVLGVGLIGGFGRILEKYTRMSIQALDHFAKSDTHATQYSLIAQSLLTTALEHLERQELQERHRRTENSSQLFGLVPYTQHANADSPDQRGVFHPQPSPVASSSRRRESFNRLLPQHQSFSGNIPTRLEDIDSSFLGMTESLMQTPDLDYWNGNMGADGDAASAFNLFPLLDAGGGIDLAHYL